MARFSLPMLSRGMCVLTAWLSLTTGGAQAVEQSDEALRMGRLRGRVVIEGSNEPLAGVKLQILTGNHAERPGQQYGILATHTDQEGNYSFDLPFGHVWLAYQEPPAGFWIDGQLATYFALTPKAPIAEKNFIAKIGTTWAAKVIDQHGEPVSGAVINSFAEPAVGYVQSTTNADGKGSITLHPKGVGAFHCAHLERLFVPSLAPKRIEAEPGFNPLAIAESKSSENGAWSLVDAAGKKATVTGASVVVRDKAVEIQLTGKLFDQDPTLTVKGAVTDEQGRPLAGAIVLFRGHGLPTHGRVVTRTDERGEFTFSGVVAEVVPGSSTPFMLSVLKRGFVLVETSAFTFGSQRNGEYRLPAPIVMKPGNTIQLRIFDAHGNIVEGAWVQPLFGETGGSNVFRTQPDGSCQLTDLPDGIHDVIVRFGDQVVRQKVVAAGLPVPGDEVVVRLRPSQDNQNPVARAAAPVREPLKVGDVAPEWKVTQWLDGENRTLADYRGKVVVIDFWGIWCSGCILKFPAIMNLQKKYADKGVVFLSIHSPGYQASEVAKLVALKKLTLPVGLDEGTEISEGTTALRYGIHGTPGMFVIDREGRVARNFAAKAGDRAEILKRGEELARKLNIPWPMDKDAIEEEIVARGNRLAEALLTQEIDAALAKK